MRKIQSIARPRQHVQRARFQKSNTLKMLTNIVRNIFCKKTVEKKVVLKLIWKNLWTVRSACSCGDFVIVDYRADFSRLEDRNRASSFTWRNANWTTHGMWTTSEERRSRRASRVGCTVWHRIPSLSAAFPVIREPVAIEDILRLFRRSIFGSLKE